MKSKIFGYARVSSKEQNEERQLVAFKEYGIDKKEFDKVMEYLPQWAFDDQCTGSNPRYPLISEIKDLFLKAYYGK